MRLLDKIGLNYYPAKLDASYFLKIDDSVPIKVRMIGDILTTTRTYNGKTFPVYFTNVIDRFSTDNPIKILRINKTIIRILHTNNIYPNTVNLEITKTGFGFDTRYNIVPSKKLSKRNLARDIALIRQHGLYDLKSLTAERVKIKPPREHILLK